MEELRDYQRVKAGYRRAKSSGSQSRKSRQRMMQIPRGYPEGIQVGEMKYVDTSLNVEISNTETIICINPMAEGNSVNTRVGRQVTLKSVECQWALKGNGVNPGDIIAWAIVYDRQTNAAAPVWTDVFDTDTNLFMMRNHDNKRRFKVFVKERLPTPRATIAGGPDYSMMVRDYYRKLRHPTEFNGTNGGAVADITTGGLFFMCQVSAADGADDCTLYGQTRVRYTDI